MTKFLKCVNWKVPLEAKQATELMVRWQAIDVVDALELLSPAFSNPLVRKYAVSRLEWADDEVRCCFSSWPSLAPQSQGSCIHTHARTCAHTHAHTTHTHTHTHTRTHPVHTHTHTHVHVHIHAHKNTHTHIHTNARAHT